MASNTIQHYGPAPTDNSGTLSCLVQQVSDSSPLYDANQQTYQVKYKGPYQLLKDIPARAAWSIGSNLTTALQSLSPVQVISRFAAPDLPSDRYWSIQSIQIEELEAGSHAVMTVKCTGSVQTSGSSSGENDPYSDTWNLRWESYTMRAYGFSSNEGTGFPIQTPTQRIDADVASQKSSRERVDMYLNGKDHGMKDNQYWYRDDDGTGYWLNHKDKLLLKKVLEDKSALYHYPVLTHTTVEEFSGNLSAMLKNNPKYSQTIGDHIDTIVLTSSSFLSSCPYKFPEDKWTWIKTGDDMTHTKSKAKQKISYQRTETFMGVISADVNFYGTLTYDTANPETTRWNPGQL